MRNEGLDKAVDERLNLQTNEPSLEEWNTLCKALFQLIDQHEQLKNQLMKEESICLEIERQPWWGCLDGDRDSWSLQIVLESNGESLRGFEAFWPVPAAQAITDAMRTVWDCCY